MLFRTFLWRPLHDYDVKPPNLTFYGGRWHTTTNFPSSFLTLIKSSRIQLQEKSPAVDILSGSKSTRSSLKERKFIVLPTFSLPSSSSLLKVPIKLDDDGQTMSNALTSAFVVLDLSTGTSFSELWPILIELLTKNKQHLGKNSLS